MAAGFLSPPGTKHGPCSPTCNHLDCEACRAMAESICPYCGQPIGYERLFYRLDNTELAHADCVEERTEESNQ